MLNRRSGIDLRHLEILHAVVETGKTTAAAQRLGTSQSAVSRGIAQLEAQLGRLLSDLQGGRLVPTCRIGYVENALRCASTVWNCAPAE